MSADVSTLEQIFRMMSPIDLLGNVGNTLGKSRTSSDPISEIQRIIYNNGANGALGIDDLKTRLSAQLQSVTDEEGKKQFNRAFRLYSSTGPLQGAGTAQYEYVDPSDGVTVKPNVSFDQIIKGGTGYTLPPDKKMSVILCGTTFITPAVRNADKVETFLNFMPSIVMSRCVPFLEVEFVFDRPNVAPLQSPGLMKFLLGSPPSGELHDDLLSSKPQTATGKMAALHSIVDPQTHREKTTSNMELFTAPQTLVNPSPVSLGSRYVDIIDPMRPLASLESFVVNVTPTVGLYSYKKGTMTFKLHDRSRLSEIGDLIRPQIYTDTTVWVTYGWRHPREPGNPYADFINNNMLVREAYGIVNSGFAFDHFGQVSVTLELFTKGVTELRSLKLPDSNGSVKAFQDIRALAEKVSEYRRALNIGKPEGLNKEIRAIQVLDSAESGTFPDGLSSAEVQSAIDALSRSFKTQGGKIDTVAANKLVSALNDLYKHSNGQSFDYKEQVKQQSKDIIRRKFDELTGGADPFMWSSQKWADYQQEAGLTGIAHPYLNFIEAYNRGKANPNIAGLKNKLVSFAKLFTVFAGQLITSVPGIDELQVFFYPFNDRAGLAAGTNVGEFPIDMPVFLDQYREHVERKGTDRLTLEEFLQLVVEAQINDDRAVAYGFRDFFEPPFSGAEAKLNSKKQGDFESAISNVAGRGPFAKPVLEVFIETVYKTNNGTDVDLLAQFEHRATDAGHSGSPNSGRSDDLTKIMRIHVFDKQAHPYKLQTKLLRADVGGNPTYLEVPNDFVTKVSPDEQKLLKAAVLNGTPLDQIVTTGGQPGTVNLLFKQGFSNQDVKNLVSKMMPTIVYGMNSSMVVEANLASKQDPLLATTQMLGNKAGRPSPTQPNGGGIGGMPLRIVPASMQMKTMGCPLISYASLFFCDFNTGTTCDNIYGVTGLTHTISPGKFETQLTMTYVDSYGKYENPPSLVEFFKNLEVPQPKGQ